MNAQNIVIDTGYGLCKAGIAGEDLPSAVFPRKFISKDSNRVNQISTSKEMNKKEENTFEQFMNNFNDLEKLWHHTFYFELLVDPAEHFVLLAEPPLTPKPTREKITEIMCEKFKTSAFFLANQAPLALYATGRTRGLVVECGDATCHCVPVYESSALDHATLRVDVAGKDLTDYLTKLIQDRGHFLTSPLERELVRNMKEKLGYVSLDPSPSHSLSSSPSSSYELPDGQQIKISNERFLCAEPLFSPSLLNKKSKSPGIHQTAFASIMKCDADLHKDLFENIILSGGTSMFPGFAERMTKELTQLVTTTPVNIRAQPERKYGVWIGGSILACLSSFQHLWITRSLYDE